MELTSSAFENNGRIPSKYTCDGDRTLSPPLSIQNVPEGTRSLALVMEDIDVPTEKIPSGKLVHWVLYNLPPDTAELPEDFGKQAPIPILGTNGKGSTGYFGPCPPPEFEPSEHRYVFTAHAASSAPAFEAPPTKDELLDAIRPYTLATAELIGRYARGVQ